VKTIVFSCPEGYYTWNNEYRKLFKRREDFGFELYHISEYIIKKKLLEDISFPNLGEIKVTYHDPCRLGRMSDIYDAPRDILNQIPGIKLLEMENNKVDADCCGVSAYISCNQNSKLLQESRVKQAIETGADYLITTCPKCLTHLNCYLNENKELKNKIQVIDLLTFIGKMLFMP
jgi:Fe-S oxidoreductase